MRHSLRGVVDIGLKRIVVSAQRVRRVRLANVEADCEWIAGAAAETLDGCVLPKPDLFGSSDEDKLSLGLLKREQSQWESAPRRDAARLASESVVEHGDHDQSEVGLCFSLARR